MMVETATVVYYENGVARVQCSAKHACGGCAARTACGTKALSALAGERFAPQFEFIVNEPLIIGEQVRIGLEEQALLLSVFWVYCVPLAALVISAVGFSYLFTNELWTAFSVFTTVGVTFGAVKKITDKMQGNKFTPVFLGRI